jgi:hypothetical protein
MFTDKQIRKLQDSKYSITYDGFSWRLFEYNIGYLNPENDLIREDDYFIFANKVRDFLDNLK